MMSWRTTPTCERLEQWISLELDGEISALERIALARHLERCADCRLARAEIGAFTRLIRDAPVVEPARPLAAASPRVRRRPLVRAGALALAAALAAGVGLVFASGSVKPSVSALGFDTRMQERQFAQVHAETEPVLFLVATPPPLSFGARALR